MIPPGALAMPINPPMSGTGSPGCASCHRMIIISVKPSSRNSNDVTVYWMPMILWSTEKTHFRRKLCS